MKSATISFVICSDDIEREDFISSSDGNNHERTFRCSVDVRTALHQAGIVTDGRENLIDDLDEGIGFEIPITEEQFTTFHAMDRQDTPIALSLKNEKASPNPD
jgi:hypothetical protein